MCISIHFELNSPLQLKLYAIKKEFQLGLVRFHRLPNYISVVMHTQKKKMISLGCGGKILIFERLSPFSK